MPLYFCAICKHSCTKTRCRLQAEVDKWAAEGAYRVKPEVLKRGSLIAVPNCADAGYGCSKAPQLDLKPSKVYVLCCIVV